MAAVTVCTYFEAQENKVCHCFHFSPSIWHEVMGLDIMILAFWMLSFKPAFSLPSFTFIRRFFSSPSLSTIRVVSSAYLEMPDHLTCLLRNLYSDQEATVRTKYGNMDCILSIYICVYIYGYCILSPAYLTYMQSMYIVTRLFNLYAEYNMWNAGLDETQAGIKIAGRNINNLSLSVWLYLAW